VSLIAKHQNQSVKLFAKSQDAIGNALNQHAPSQNVSWYVKIQTAHQKLNAAPALMECLELLNHSHSLKKLSKIKNAAHAISDNYISN